MTADRQPAAVDPAWAFRRRVTGRDTFAGQVPAPVYLWCDDCDEPLPGRRPKYRHGFGFTAGGDLLILDQEARKNLKKRDGAGNTVVGTSGLVADSDGATFRCGWHSTPTTLTLSPQDLLALARHAAPPGVRYTFSQVRHRVSR